MFPHHPRQTFASGPYRVLWIVVIINGAITVRRPNRDVMWTPTHMCACIRSAIFGATKRVFLLSTADHVAKGKENTMLPQRRPILNRQ